MLVDFSAGDVSMDAGRHCGARCPLHLRYMAIPSFPEGDCRLARAVGVGWHPGDRREPQEKPCGGCVLGRTKRVSEFAQLRFRGTDGSGCREGSTDCCKSLA